MQHTPIKSLLRGSFQGGETVTVCGWAKTVRDSKNIGFIELSDGSCFSSLQVVFEAQKLENYKEIAKAGVGTSLRVKGVVVLTPDAKQPLEINAGSVEVLGTCPSDYPLQKKRHTVEFLRTMPHLRARTNTFSAAFRVRSAAAYAIHKFFQEQGFVYVHTPIITGSDCEGAGEMFRVTTMDFDNVPRTEDGKVDFSQDFFGRSTNLTVSGQLEAEAMATAMGNVYTFGPTFRAENSNTPRHAAEFWMIEPELAFADLRDDMDCAEAMIKSVIGYVMEHCRDELEFFNRFFDKELLDNVIVENQQAIEMAQIYREIIDSTRELMSSVVNLRMNNVVKRLTSVTVIFSVPMIISGMYGMNVDERWMPLAKATHGFGLIGIMTVVICAILALFLKRHRMM